MIIKQNQPTLYAAVQLVFDEPPLPRRPGESHSTRTVAKAHGRWERRTLATTTALNDYVRWPGTAQVLRRICRRSHERTGRIETEVTYAITSLPPTLAGPAELEHIWRGHWTIENRLHYVRDETFREDRCQVHGRTSAQAFAALRNAVISLFRAHGWSNLAAATRRYAAQPQRLLQLIGATAL